MIERAQQNLLKLSMNPYPGRGVLIGRDITGTYIVQATWTMGRSDDSRNRIYKKEGVRVFTEEADKSRPAKNPELTLYNAMDEHLGRIFGISNGAQTDAIVGGMKIGKTFEKTLSKFIYEPDPNSTSRISGVVQLDNSGPLAQLSLIRKADDSDRCHRHFYQYESLPPGFGYALTTYETDGNPLPPFRGEPILLPLLGSQGEIIALLPNHLNRDNIVSVAVKIIKALTGESVAEIWNKFSSVPLAAMPA
jgi:IMP cyclohydrolase